MKTVIYNSKALNPKTKSPYIIEELTEATEDMIRLRAMALNWVIISISQEEGY